MRTSHITCVAQLPFYHSPVGEGDPYFNLYLVLRAMLRSHVLQQPHLVHDCQYVIPSSPIVPITARHEFACALLRHLDDCFCHDSALPLLKAGSRR
jgi:hypothetical protein